VPTIAKPVDWRALLSEIGVGWIDRGANTKRGYVNIACPFCGNDPSHHLSISETTGYYRCWRNDQHSGQPLYLLQRLIGNRTQAQILIDEYEGSGSAAPVKQKISITRNEWDRFTLASDLPHVAQYIRSRGFPNAAVTAAQFDLRAAASGQWANRLLIPLHDASMNVKARTGRSISSSMEPRYLVRATPDSDKWLCGDFLRPLALFVEGPLDHIKLNVASRLTGQEIGAIALQGTSITSGRLRSFVDADRGWQGIAVCIDAEASLSLSLRWLSELRAAFPRIPTVRVRLPDGVKDGGEMSVEESSQWLMGVSNAIRTAMAKRF
jgi:hypothetical protein